MKRFFFWCCALLAILFLTVQMNAAEVNIQQPIVQILAYGKGHLFVTPNRIFSQGLKQQVQFSIPFPATAAVIQDGQVWVATTQGLYRFELQLPEKKALVLFEGKAVSSLALDRSNHLWAGVTYTGVFRQEANDRFALKLQIPAVSSLIASRSDTNVWVGTNVGLYRVGIYHFTTTRYAEEGYSGYELPDNIVEKLFGDAAGNVWVLMPQNISFKKSSSYQGELPTFAFLGDRTNEVYSIQAVGSNWYLFCTQKGLSFMPAHPLQEDHVHPTTEVYSDEGMQAWGITLPELSCPKAWQHQAVTQVLKSGADVWFVTPLGAWSVPEKRLHRIFRKRMSEAGVPRGQAL